MPHCLRRRQRGLECNLIGLILVLIAIGVCGLSTQPDDELQIEGSPSEQTYLLPILLYGPHNQKRDLRSYLALCKELRAGLVLTGLFKHYIDRNKAAKKAPARDGSQGAVQCFREETPHWMMFDEVIDREPLQSWLPTTTVEDLKATGWNGKLDALVVGKGRLNFTARYVAEALQALHITLPQQAALIDMEEWLHCNRSRLVHLRKAIQPYRVVGIVMVWLGLHLESDAAQVRGEVEEPPLDRCHRNIYKANRLIRPAAWLQGLATSYVEHQLHTNRFVAVHVRPYPDECLLLWQAGQLGDEEVVKANCKGEVGTLHQQVGPCVAQLLQETGIQVVFVLTHPMVRNVVNGMLAQAGVHGAHFLDTHVVSRLAGCEDNTASFLVMVEEAIALQAEHFLGTSWSSITQNIAYERMSNGLLNNSYFENMQCGATAEAAAEVTDPEV